MKRDCFHPLATRLLLLLLLLMTASHTLWAQRITIVSGKVLNLPEGERKPRPFPADEIIRIWGFHTVAAAKEAMKALESGSGFISPDAETMPGSDGYYELNVSETGAILVMVQNTKELAEVNHRDVINFSINGGIQIEQVDVVGQSKTIKPDPKAGKIIGNKLILDSKLDIPRLYGASNRRLIAQPYVLDCMTEDTIFWVRPQVIEGDEYQLTQERRMLYDNSRDPIAQFVTARLDTLSETTPMTVEIKDTVLVKDPKRSYSASLIVNVSDYTQNLMEESYPIMTCKTKRPLQFLEFSFPEFTLDANKYKETPRREKRGTTGNIQLTFLVGKAELDDSDSTNVVQLAKMQSDLMAIINGEGTTLKEFKITGVSSPEGRYATNLELSRRRIAFAVNKFSSAIPHRQWEMVYKHPHEVRVATWSEVADLLEQDSLTAQAAEIRAIEEQYKDRDAQFAAVRRLSYYDTLIKDRLPKLRTVQYQLVYEIFRELNPDEIVDRYYHDPDYISGKKSFTRYEFWNLFDQIKEPKEAEKIYQRAYEETMAYDAKGKPMPWVLAANNLAVAILRRDTFNTEILHPLIDLKSPVNKINRFNDGFGEVVTEVNPEAVVANQLAMYIRADNFEEASVLAKMLPNTERFRMVKAFAECLGGYYDRRNVFTQAEKEKCDSIFQLVRSSSPLNNIIMLMAKEMPAMDKEASKAMESMEMTPTLEYLKIVLFIRLNKLTTDPEFEFDQSKFIEACQMLDALIKKDKKFYKIAMNDGEFTEEFMKFYDQGDWKFY